MIEKINFSPKTCSEIIWQTKGHTIYNLETANAEYSDST